MDNDDDIFQGLERAASLLNGCWFFTGVYWGRCKLLIK